MLGPSGYKIRLRVLLANCLNTDDTTRSMVVAEREVTITTDEKGKSFKENGWIVLTARGFSSEGAARSFGDRLRSILEIAGICSRNGVDVGHDKATSSMSEALARLLEDAAGGGFRMGSNVHGLALLPDDDKTMFNKIQGTATLLADPTQFFGALAEIKPDVPSDFSVVGQGIRTMNMALGTPSPLARIVIAISAVEALGQSETWTSAQKGLLNELAALAKSSANLSQTEREEVAEALRRGSHRLGLRQGVMRVLASLELQHLLKEWDRIYQSRSGIFHGTLKMQSHEIGQLAHEAMTLCGHIILTHAQSNGVRLPTIASTHFPGLERQHS